MPQLVEDALFGTRSFDASMAKVLGPNKKEPAWRSWHMHTVIWPRRSITGKFIFGQVNRSSRDEFEVPFGVYLGELEPGTEHRYATDKELFKAKLEGTA